MAKKKEVIDLYGKNFTVIHPKNPLVLPPVRYENLYEAYDKPSDIKTSIWMDWKLWFGDVLSDNNGGRIYITSRNCNFFSIGGYIDSPNGERWAFYITYTRQECWKVRDL